MNEAGSVAIRVPARYLRTVTLTSITERTVLIERRLRDIDADIAVHGQLPGERDRRGPALRDAG